jgi:hypothetical protein
MYLKVEGGMKVTNIITPHIHLYFLCHFRRLCIYFIEICIIFKMFSKMNLQMKAFFCICL